MKVFISWSGTKSKQIGEELTKFIPLILQSVKPYFSPSDIEKGSKWESEISKNLNDCIIGIICLTPENKNSPWILFEAGALSNRLEKAKVCPLLFEMTNSDITGPLSTFQTTVFNKPELRELISSINKQLGENKVNETIIEQTFASFYPSLEEKINSILSSNKNDNNIIQDERTDRDILEEILELTRRQYNPTPKMRTIRLFSDEKEDDFIDISPVERELVYNSIYKLLDRKGFRLSDISELDENMVFSELEGFKNIRTICKTSKNFKRLISEFKERNQ